MPHSSGLTRDPHAPASTGSGVRPFALSSTTCGRKADSSCSGGRVNPNPRPVDGAMAGTDSASVSMGRKRVARGTTLMFAHGSVGRDSARCGGLPPHDPSFIPTLRTMNFAVGRSGARSWACPHMNRQRHLVFVAGALWLVNLIRVSLGKSSVEGWAGISLTVAMGGGRPWLFYSRTLNHCPPTGVLQSASSRQTIPSLKGHNGR